MLRGLSLLGILVLTSTVMGQSDAGPLLERLKSGKLPPEKQVIAVRLICQRGNADDLAYIFRQTVDPKAFSPANRTAALEGLEEAFVQRKVQPKGDLSGLKTLFAQGDENNRATALRLAGHWKLAAAAADLERIAAASDTSDGLRKAAVEGLVGLGTGSFASLSKLAESSPSLKVRYLAAAGLGRLAADRAASLAAAVLTGGNDVEDPAPVVLAFLDQKGGADLLARALVEKKPNADAARMALRTMYAVGRSDAALTDVLSKAAGITLNPTKPSPAEIKVLAEEVMSKGDAARGETIFRRLDLSCFRCHALHGAGGSVGPDLGGVGTTSPADYLLRAILDPAADVKEEYLAQRIATEDGKIYQGIVVEEDAEKLVLRDANGEKKTIRLKSIEERDKGGSLMPSGLANFLTRRELVDLVRYLNELGKPGAYAIPTIRSIRRWKVLREVSADLVGTTPDSATLTEQVLNQPATRWLPLYARASGVVPLEEAAAATGKKVLYLVGEIDVTAEGAVAFQVDRPEGVVLWVAGQRATLEKNRATVDLPVSKASVVLRVDLAQRGAGDLRVDLLKPEGSMAEFTAVGGP